MTHKIDGGVPAARLAETTRAAAPARAGAGRGEPVAATPGTDSMRLTGEAEELKLLQRGLAATPPDFDAARVDALRAAIADGSYRVDADAVAARMLELDQALGG